MNPSNKADASGKRTFPTPPLSKKRKDSVAEILLMKHLGELLIGYFREYHFHPERKWRFDFVLNAYPFPKIAIEIEGGSWVNGRHNRGKGFENDARKYNAAALLGWRIIRFTPNMIERGESKAFLAELFGRQPWTPPEPIAAATKQTTRTARGNLCREEDNDSDCSHSASGAMVQMPRRDRQRP